MFILENGNTFCLRIRTTTKDVKKKVDNNDTVILKRRIVVKEAAPLLFANSQAHKFMALGAIQVGICRVSNPKAIVEKSYYNSLLQGN